MWKRDEAVKPTSGQPATPAPVVSTPSASTSAAPQPDNRRIERDMVNIGKSVVIKGELNGSEDLTIDGQVEGKIELKDHVLTIGPNGDVQGEVSAKQVTVVGKIAGNVVASERIEVRETGRIQGDLIAPRLTVAEGAVINGAITMKDAGSLGQVRPAEKKPEIAHTPSVAPAVQKVG